MHFDPKLAAELAIVAVLVALNVPGIFAWISSRLGAVAMPSQPAKADRTPGEVLDCLNADLGFLRTNTDAPPELLASVEALAPYLMHVKARA